MHDSRHTARGRLAKLFIVIATAMLVGAAGAGPAFAGASITIIPVSSGVDEGGACSQVSGSGITQTWEFRADNIFTNQSAALLSAEFSDGTTVDGVAPTTTDDVNNQATWLVTTPAGATLVSASADVTNSSPDGATLTIVGCTLSGAAPTTTAAPTTVAPTTVAPTPTTAAAAAELPHTGSGSALAAALGFLVLAAGLGLMFVSRRAAKAG